MCGVAGVVGPLREIDREWVSSCQRALAHRGPDGSGYHEPLPGSTTFAHTRLAIVDLTDTGTQPMWTDDRRYCLVYNGEIYNARELRMQLESIGCQFHGTSDSEVLLHAFATWGSNCVTRFDGMWAFAICDTLKKTVFLSRDRFGIKPLYITASNGRLAFASEVRPLTTWLGKPEQNWQAAFDYLSWGHVDRGLDTMVKGVQAFPAGHNASMSAEMPELRPTRYWSLEARPPSSFSPGPSERQRLIDEVRSALISSVKLQLRSDAPLGLTLSGGLDSSALLGILRHDVDSSIHPIAVTYCAGEQSGVIDEGAVAERTAKAWGADWIPAHVIQSDEVDILLASMRAQYEPFGSYSIVAQHAVYQTASAAGAKVMLDGQGADELFSGYPSFVIDRFVEMLRTGRYKSALKLASSASSVLGTTPFIRAIVRSLPAPLAKSLSLRWMRSRIPKSLDLAWFRNLGVNTSFDVENLGRSLDQSLGASLSTTSLPSLLRYADRGSMFNGVECRVPFLGSDVVRAAMQLPLDLLIGADGTTKPALRLACADIIHPDILASREKIAFAAPSNWRSRIVPPNLPFLRTDPTDSPQNRARASIFAGAESTFH
jgi:asparagine synthase (glutamine-hydrolysing)